MYDVRCSMGGVAFNTEVATLDNKYAARFTKYHTLVHASQRGAVAFFGEPRCERR